MTTPRALLAAAIRPFGPDGRLLPEHVAAFDAFADALGIPRDGGNNAPSPISEPLAAPQIGLTEADFARVAKRLRCSVAQIRAVWEVESGGGWFTDVRKDILELDGPGGFLGGPHLPKILFEAHKFHKYTRGRFTASHPKISSRRWNRKLYVGGVGEYTRLFQAMQLDHDAALMSASVGGAQIMGFNHKLAGFDTVAEFWDAMKSGEPAHLDAFASFVENSGLAGALRKVSRYHAACAPFARGYNGSGYASHRPGYHIRIARAFHKWSRK